MAKTKRDINMTQSIQVRFLGVFKKAYGKDQLILQTKGRQKLGAVIRSMVDSSSELRRVLLDAELHDPRPNSVILVNGREIGVLNGLETEIGDGDEIVFIPVIHGG